MTLATALRNEMDRHNLSQHDVARRTGLAQPTILAYLDGALPKLDAFKVLVREFPCIITVLFSSEGE